MQNLTGEGGEEMDKKEELTQIVRRVQGDMNRFEELYTHTINKVYYWCYMVVKDESLAKDLAQESMIKLYDKFHTLKNPESFTSWMYTLVRNVCYLHLRANKHGETVSLESEPQFKEGLEEEDMAHLPEASYDLEETKSIIISFIETLPRKQREVITLFYLEELKITEIGKVLECNTGVIKSRLHSGRNNLENQIDQYQKKHGTKLYSTIVLPFLGAIIQNHSDELCQKQNLKYNKSLYQPKSFLKNTVLKSVLSLNPITLVSASLGILLVIGVGTFLGLNHEFGKEKGPVRAPVASAADFDKNGKDPYVASVTYNEFPSRSETKVLIRLKKEVNPEMIQVFFENEPVLFQQKGKELTIIAKENGDYRVMIGKTKKVITVDNLDAYAPELVDIENRGDYLALNIRDEQNQIDYTTSYMTYEGKSYKITEDGKVWGNFKGEVIIYLYNHKDAHMYYRFNLN